MKKIILAAAAAAALAAGASPADAQDFGGHRGNDRGQVTQSGQHGRHAQPGRTVQVNRNVQVNHYAAPARGFSQGHRWNRGERFDRRYATNYQVIRTNPRLYAAPRGYQWVRSGNDAVLVSIAGGIVGALIANLF